jgi:predicted anti-sigma-YlaC factor YlaD
MSCNFCEEKIEAYVLGLLNEQDQAQVAEHIQNCFECRQALERHQKTTRLLDQAFQEKPAEWLSQRTLARLKDSKVQPKRWLQWGVPALAGAAAVLLLVVIRPGQIAKQSAMQPAQEMRMSSAKAVASTPKAKKEMAMDAMLLASKDDSLAGASVALNQMLAKKRSKAVDSFQLPAAPVPSIAEQLDIQVNNPIQDRSIYEDLGVATEVAKLLL